MEKSDSKASLTPELASDVLKQVTHKDKRDERVYDQLLKSIGKVIEDNYPGIHTMEAEGYRKLNERISQHIINLRSDIGNTLYEHRLKNEN